jgi:hypothetical protein
MMPAAPALSAWLSVARENTPAPTLASQVPLGCSCCVPAFRIGQSTLCERDPPQSEAAGARASTLEGATRSRTLRFDVCPTTVDR